MAKKIAIDIDIQGTKDVLDLQKAIRNTKKELKETEDIKAYDNLAKDLVKLQAQLKEARKRQRQAVDAFAATDKGIGAYSRLSAQLRVARNNLKDLAAAGQTTGKEVDDLTKEINELDTTLKDIDRSVGQTNREVGNYEEAIRKATGLTEKQTGAFTRMNGKLNVLKKSYKDVVIAQGSTSKGAKELRKEIDKLERTLKQAGDTGQKAGKRIGGIRTQLKGLGGPLAGLASGFLIFSELPAALGDINEGLHTLGATFSVAEAQNQAFTKGIQESAQALQEEQGDLALNIATIKDKSLSDEERTAAINAVNEAYGPYIDNLLTESSSLEEITAFQQAATAALIDNLAAQAAATFQQETLNSLTADFGDKITIAAEAQTGLGQTIDNTSKAAAGPLGLLVELFTGVEASVTGVKTAINEAEIATKTGLLGQGKEIEKDFAEGLTEISGFLEENNAALIESARIRQEEAAADRLAREEKAAQKRAAAAAKRAEEEARRILERNAANQEKFLEQEIQNAKRREQVLLKLSEQLDTAILQNLEEGEEKQIKLEQDASQRRIKNLKAQQKAFEDQQTEQVQKAISIFGFQSQEVIDLEKKTGEELERIRGSVNALITQETEASLTRQEQIREDFAAQEISNQKRLNEEKKKLEDQATADLIKAEQERKEAREQNAQFALETAAKIIGAIDNIAQASSEKRIKRVEEDEEERAANIENLQASLQSASGLEAAFLQQQIDQETKAAEQLAAKKERIEKDAAINSKAIAIVQAVINTALGITNALASLPPPFSFITAGITGALGAVEIATIAAQPLATGGIVGQPQNIKTQPNGDNVLTTLKRGEVVLNKSQQSRLGGAKTFASIGVPGFARGGIVSPPMGAPSLPALQSDANTSTDLLSKMAEMVEATNNRIDRIEVNYTTNTADAIQNDKTDKKEIKERATL